MPVSSHSYEDYEHSLCQKNFADLLRQYALADQSVHPFASHVAMYPVCWAYNNVPGYAFKDLSGSPVLIQEGTADQYDAPDSCMKLRDSLPDRSKALVTIQMYEKTTHAFDGDNSFLFFDPYAFLGKGGEVTVTANREVGREARARAISFVLAHLPKGN